MAARDRRNIAITFAAAIVLALGVAVVAGEMLGGHVGRRTLAMMANLPATAPAMTPGRPANPAPLPSPLPRPAG
jgi:hypothetical protein